MLTVWAAWNKPVAKAVVARSGIETPDYVPLPQTLFRDLGAQLILDSIVNKLGLPLVVKPPTCSETRQGGSALGVSMVTARACALDTHRVLGLQHLFRTNLIVSEAGPHSLLRLMSRRWAR